MNFEPKAPIDFASVSELLKRNTSKYPEKAAVVTVNPHTLESVAINHRELKDLVFKTANWLLNLGVAKNDRFAILMHNTAEILIFELAGSLIGATTVPLDSKRDTLERTLFKIEQTGAKVLFETVGDESREDLGKIKSARPELKIFSWKSLEEFEDLLPADGKTEFNDTLNTHYVILYTSGTTNMPKGVPLKISSCLLNAKGIAVWQEFTDQDIFNLVLPLHHINSTIFSLAILISGGTIIMNTTYSTSGFWKVIDKFRCTNSSIVPTILHDLLLRNDEFFQANLDITSMKRICIGSAPVLPQQTLKFVETFGVRVVQGYGQTETALRVTGMPVNLDESSYKEMVKLNSIGLELANCAVEILDQEKNLMKEGEEGEICISGPVLGDGYLNDLEATGFSFKDNWFHSGDLGFFKEMEVTAGDGTKIKDNFFFIVGRIKEIIIKGGVNISPSAVEDALHKNFPEIDEVSVVGIPDARMGEEIAAVIVPKAGTEEALIRQKFENHDPKLFSLTPYEIPRQIFFMESLPKTSTGKIQRVQVKKIIAQRLEDEKTPDLFVREIKPSESKYLEKAVEINNDRFNGLPASLDEFRSRTENGKLFGVFNKAELIGSLSCLRVNKSDIDKFRTWQEAGEGGFFTNNNPDGDTLLCMAISIEGKGESEKGKEKVNGTKLEQLAKEKIEEYLNSGLDHVLSFHSKSKAGIAGAEIFKVLPSGRKDDLDSMGFNVIVKYPQISGDTKLVSDPAASASIKLIEFALFYAKESGVKNIFAFSRPSGFRKYLIEKYG